MAGDRRNEIIEILDCDLAARPQAAPGIDALLPHVLRASRTPGALLVEFDLQVEPMLAAFVEAERLCCAGIGWEIELDTAVRLRITAADTQIDAIERLWQAST